MANRRSAEDRCLRYLAGAEIDRRIRDQRGGTIGKSRSTYLRTLEGRLKADPEVMAHLTAVRKAAERAARTLVVESEALTVNSALPGLVMRGELEQAPRET